jgi:hypothetical protein
MNSANGSSAASLASEVAIAMVAELGAKVKAPTPAVGIDPNASIPRVAHALKRRMTQRRFRWLITAMSELDRADRKAARKAANGNGRAKPRVVIIDRLADQIPAGTAD